VANDPISQFNIKTIFELPKLAGQDISFTNSSLWMSIAAVGVIVFFALTAKRKQVPGRMQSLGELSYEFIADMVRSTTGQEAMKFFPFIFTLFFFILFINVLGMNPYSFTATSHLAVTGALALFTVGMVLVLGIAKNGLRFFKIFAPSGLPMVMYPLLVPIEIISFISRPITLSVRLFANMMAGHVLLKIFATFIAFLSSRYWARSPLWRSNFLSPACRLSSLRSSPASI